VGRVMSCKATAHNILVMISKWETESRICNPTRRRRARTWGTRGKRAIMVAFRRWCTNWQFSKPRMTTGAFEFLGTRAKAHSLLFR